MAIRSMIIFAALCSSHACSVSDKLTAQCASQCASQPSCAPATKSHRLAKKQPSNDNEHKAIQQPESKRTQRSTQPVDPRAAHPRSTTTQAVSSVPYWCLVRYIGPKLNGAYPIRDPPANPDPHMARHSPTAQRSRWPTRKQVEQSWAQRKGPPYVELEWPTIAFPMLRIKLRKQLGGVERCYRKLLAKQHAKKKAPSPTDVTGTITLHLLLGKTWRVRQITNTSHELARLPPVKPGWGPPRSKAITLAGLERCVLSTAKKWRFPRPKGHLPRASKWGLDFRLHFMSRPRRCKKVVAP
jgi:hypothetical protein